MTTITLPPLPGWAYRTAETEAGLRARDLEVARLVRDRLADVIQSEMEHFIHTHAAAVSADLSAENARLREAIQHYEAALKEAWPEGAKGKSFEHWNTARIAVHGSRP
jgi:hypothetical protein